jgi:GPN-loop GTPase
MLQLELPHVNVLSKIDLVEKFGKLDLNLEFYTTGTDLEYLQLALNREDKSGRFAELNQTLCELIEDFSLVSFTTLNINEKESVARLVKLIDKSNGYVYSGMDGDSSLLEAIATADVDFEYYRVGAVQEKYMDTEVDMENLADIDDGDSDSDQLTS